MAIVDRVNVGIAKLRMQGDLHFSDTAYGFGAGVFFVGYFLFEVPANLWFERIGARRFIARILLGWGPLAALTAFVRTPLEFYAVRFALGIGEAGLFPAIVLFLTYWFPPERRTRYLALFMLGLPIAGIVVGPLSTQMIVWLDGAAGLKGWQWMFVAQGIPAMALGLVAAAWLDDRPADAKWLTNGERATLLELVGPAPETHLAALVQIRAALRQRGFVSDVLTYFMIISTVSSFSMWAPQFVQDLRGGDLSVTGLALGSIFAAATVVMASVGALGDRSPRRERLLVAMLVTATAAFATSAFWSNHVTLALIALGVGACGYLAAMPPFWGSLTPRMSASSAAAAIALVNSLGNLGGATGPPLVGAIKQRFGLSPAIGSLAAMTALSTLFFCFGAGRRRRLAGEIVRDADARAGA